jgi:tetratricopeptide (TPR) repeat protein
MDNKDSQNQNLASLSILADAIKNSPSNPDNYLKRALLNIKIENYTDALVDINRAERLNPNSGVFLFVKAKIQNFLKDKNALSNALEAENQNYDLPELYTLIADIYIQSKQFSKASAYLQKAESIYPYNSEVYLVKGKYFAQKGDTLNSVFNFKKSLKLKPHGFDAYDQLIKIYSKAHLVDSALVINELAINKFPKKTEMIYNKAFILENVGASDSALKVYSSFLKVEPTRIDVLERIGRIYYRKKNFNTAILICQKWSKAEPENIKPIKLFALCLEGQDFVTAAKKKIEEGLEIEPDNQDLKKELARYTYALEVGESIIVEPKTVEIQKTTKPKKVVAPEPERRIFEGNFGTIERIQKRKIEPVTKDTTRN